MFFENYRITFLETPGRFCFTFIIGRVSLKQLEKNEEPGVGLKSLERTKSMCKSLTLNNLDRTGLAILTCKLVILEMSV